MTASCSLGDVCTVVMGQAPDGKSYNSDGEGLPLIAGAGDFGDLFPRATKYTSQPGKVCRSGDIVLGIRATIGRKVVANGEYCLGRGVAGLRPGPKLDSRYLWHWLTHVEPTLASKGRGATFKQVNRDDIAGLAIDLPPIGEQLRIAAVLDRADALRAKRRAALALLGTLTESVFLDMFGDPAANPKGWPQARLADMGAIVTGNTPSRAEAAYFGGDFEWIKSDNLNAPQHTATQATEGLTDLGRRVARTVPAGSILVTCIAGSPECIGNAAIVDRHVAFNQRINAIVPRGMDTSFLYVQVLVGKRLIQGASTASMKGMVSKSRFSDIVMMKPPIELQREFGALFASIDALCRKLAASSTQLDALLISLQHRAFTGQL